MSEPRVPYVPTPPGVARKMLELAGAGPDDIVYDLGCGDGRILITAVKEFGVKRAVGVEIRRELVQEARKKIAAEGLSDRIEIIHGDMFEVDISEASIVTLFLLTSVNDELAPKLEKELSPGTRVVSHEFQITSWRPSVLATIHDEFTSHNIYLYVIGAHRWNKG
ncbi:protein-lysine N-methyltransferase [Pyrolobus fumarii]|uniref:protein-lysine N-methyltransferase n=1 Tax=Pyrolobus fumarii TaxID=54252 RepID=UPI00064E2FC3|nr:protein-lysine N-methyltransferase [Pyrolobus fumarii]